jgi:hypothetical protein
MKHKELRITASNPDTVIYIADDEDNLVQQEKGYVKTWLLPGRYTIHFSLKGKKVDIDLKAPMEIIEKNLAQ